MCIYVHCLVVATDVRRSGLGYYVQAVNYCMGFAVSRSTPHVGCRVSLLCVWCVCVCVCVSVSVSVSVC